MQRLLGRSESRRRRQARAEEMKKWKQPMQWRPCCWRKHLIIPPTGIIHLGAELQRQQHVWGSFSFPDLLAGGVMLTETDLDSCWALPAHEGSSRFASTSCPSQKWLSQIRGRQFEILLNLLRLQVLIANYSWDNPENIWTIKSRVCHTIHADFVSENLAQHRTQTTEFRDNLSYKEPLSLFNGIVQNWV